MANPEASKRTQVRPITKVIPPCIPAGYLRRSYLVKRFQNAIQHRVLLVIAPAGYGKTTFLCDSLSQINHPIAWLSLDKRDDHLFDFCNSLLMAVRELNPTFGEDLLTTLQEAPNDFEPILTGFINEIVASLPDLHVVLDDYHVIKSSAIHDALAYLINYLPPQAHLILASREYPPLPLHRMRGQGHVAEIRTIDLRFTLEDTAELLNNLMEVDLPDPTLRRLHSRLEGWITGLRMIVLAAQGSADVNALLASMRDSPQDIMAYLTSEVLDQQEDPVRRFLLDTSIFERFNADMCDFTFGRDDSRQMIDLVMGRNLFLQVVDSIGAWFRYHALFQSALAEQMTAKQHERLPSLHLKASLWYEQAGMLEDALDHALEAGENERALSLLDKIVILAMGQDHYDRFWVWLQRLPQDLVKNSLFANIGCAVSCEMTRELGPGNPYLQAALSISETKGIDTFRDTPYYSSLLASLSILKVLDAYHQGRYPQAIQHGEEGLATLPKDEIMGRCGILCVKGLAHWMRGDLIEAYRCCEEAASLGDKAHWQYSVCLNLSAVAHIRFARFHLNSAAETCRQIMAVGAQEERGIASSCYAYLLLARILYMRGQLSEAEGLIRQAVRLSEKGREPVLWMSSQMALARIRIVQGNPKAAVEIASRAKIAFDAAFPKDPLADLLMARLYLMMGESTLASDYVGRLFFTNDRDLTDENIVAEILQHDVFGNDVRNVWAETALLVYVRVRLANHELDDLSTLLGIVHREAVARHWKNLQIETSLLEALVEDAVGDTPAALNRVKEALALTINEDYLRIFIDEGLPMERLLRRARRKGIYPEAVDQLLNLAHQPNAASPSSASTSQPGDVEVFTRREKEILELIRMGATNQDIAQKLFLSLSTVKNHIQTIYEKLDAKNRAQAVIRAQELGLVTTSKQSSSKVSGGS